MKSVSTRKIVIRCLLLFALLWVMYGVTSVLLKPEYIRSFEESRDHKFALTELLKELKRLNISGDSQTLGEYLRNIHRYVLEDNRFDLNDFERICAAMKRYGEMSLYKTCLEKGLVGDVLDIPKTRIRLSARLINEIQKTDGVRSAFSDAVLNTVRSIQYDLISAHNISSLTSILRELNDIPATLLDDQDTLTVLTLNLNHDYEVDKSLLALKMLAKNSKHQVVRGKAYFVAGRYYINHDQCSHAIQIYNEYISSFHRDKGNARFVQKAFQRIIYCQAKLGIVDTSELKDRIYNVIDEGKDLGAYFELARNFYDVGQYETARSVMVLGIDRFEDGLESEKSDFVKIKAAVQLLRAAPLFDGMQSNADEAIKITEARLGYGSRILEWSDPDIDYIYGQFLLWAYRYLESVGRLDDAMQFLLKFIVLFEDSKDFDFAVAQLVLLCKKSGCAANDTFTVVVPSGSGQLKKVAAGNLLSFVEKMSDSLWKSKVSEWM